MPIRTKDAARAWRANEDRREAEYIAAGAAQAARWDIFIIPAILPECKAKRRVSQNNRCSAFYRFIGNGLRPFVPNSEGS